MTNPDKTTLRVKNGNMNANATPNAIINSLLYFTLSMLCLFKNAINGKANKNRLLNLNVAAVADKAMSRMI